MLVERDKDVEFLRSIVATGRRSPGGIVLVGGSAGSGKTELLRDLSEYAEWAGLKYLVATGSAHESVIPLGVLFQLLHSVPDTSDLVATATARLSELIFDAGPHAGGLAVAKVANINAEALRLAHQLAGTFARVADSTPVLIMVDDVDLADTASRNCLHHLAKMLSGTRLAMVFTMSIPTPTARPVLPCEPVESHAWHRFVLRNLSERGVARMLAQHFGADRAADAAASYHSATGGNPRLVHALIEDSRASAGTAESSSGSYFRHAVTTCLRRADENIVAVAEAAAVLAASDSLATANTRLIARMTDLEPETVATALTALDTMGITAGDGKVFRHTAGRAAVLNHANRRRRGDLHRVAARQLYVDNSSVSPAKVAVHLMAAGETSGPLARDVLVRAGSMLTSAKDYDAATRYLEIAMASADDELVHAAVCATLSRTEMRVDPAIAKRHIGMLLDAYKNNHLSDRDGGTLLWQLAWHGMLETAGTVIEWTANGNVAHATDEFASRCRLLQTAYPRLATKFVPPENAELDIRPATVHGGLRTKVADVLQTVLRQGSDPAAADSALRVLSTLQLNDETLDIAEAALETLVFSEQVGKAAIICTELLDEADRREVPLWSAVLGSVRAEIALRQGRLHAAKEYAAASLAAVPMHGWGVQCGRTLGTMVLASTRLDELGAAAKYVQSALPDAMFASRYGAQYLYARGQYYIAAQHFEAALTDFEFCGRLLREWEIDAPTLVPWRCGAAAAHLRMRDPQAAEKLLEEQLALLDRAPVNCPRARGKALLLLSGIRSAPQRVAVLREAIKLLRMSGDVYLLSRAMLALSRTHDKLGQRDRAKVLECSAAELSKKIQSGAGTAGVTKTPDRPASDEEPKSAKLSRSGLTVSEQRVAALAATGHTNREIADQLYITISTVEQHLTSVYRKLDVKRRSDLPVELLLG